VSTTPPPDQPPADRTLFHVEEQEVIYWRTAVESANAEDARAIVTGGSGDGEVVGKTLVSRLVTNVHPVTDGCVDRGCYDFDHEEREEL
jgi:hypothetical protein